MLCISSTGGRMVVLQNNQEQVKEDSRLPEAQVHALSKNRNQCQHVLTENGTFLVADRIPNRAQCKFRCSPAAAGHSKSRAPFQNSVIDTKKKN